MPGEAAPIGAMTSATATRPTQSTTIAPRQAADLVAAGGGFIVDVREPDEHRREHVAGTTLYPDSAITRMAEFPAQTGRQTLVLCRSGNRATQIATALRNLGRTDVAVIEGGLVAWQQAGLPVVRDAKAPLPIVRQVMIAAGLMQLAFTALAATVSPWFLAGTGFVGLGLTIAGITGFCPMATVLGKMPWNRATARPAPANPSQTTCSGSSCGG